MFEIGKDVVALQDVYGMKKGTVTKVLGLAEGCKHAPLLLELEPILRYHRQYNGSSDSTCIYCNFAKAGTWVSSEYFAPIEEFGQSITNKIEEEWKNEKPEKIPA